MCVKSKVEAILFAVGKKISVDDLSRLCGESVTSTKKALSELEEDYKKRDCALMISGGENVWKLNIKEKYLDLVRTIIVETDLSVPCMETLALIAYKQPSLQSDIIKQRSVGAYEHIKELMEEGFIVRQKKGRSFQLKLTPRFFEYFDVDDDKIKSLFDKFEQEDRQLQLSEDELAKLEEERKKSAEINEKEVKDKISKTEQTYAERMDMIDQELEEN
jgi:segregation and condensation protein B